jgi:hypothetical protein
MRLLVPLTALLLLGALSYARRQAAPFTTFIDVAAPAGLTFPAVYGGLERKRYIIETNGCGVGFFDYDGDGLLDALVLSGTRLEGFAPGAEPTLRLYRNRGNGTFTDVTARARVARSGWASGLAVGDYDNDGDLDFFVTYWGTNALYRNQGDGTFADATREAGLGFEGIRWGSGASFIDYDRDGDLDLFVANYLSFDRRAAPEPGRGANCVWKGIPVNCGPKGLPFARNWLYRNDRGKFVDVSEESGVARVRERYPMSVAAADFDDDGWTDLYVASDSTASILYRNNRDGTFTDVALESGVAFNEDGNAQAGMGLGIGDYDRDGRLDIFKTHFADDTPVLYRNLGRGMFEDVTFSAGFGAATRHVSWGAGLPDLDNDGWPDIFYVTGHVYPEVEKHFKESPHRGPRLVFRNLGDGKFADVSALAGAGATALHSSRGCAFGDYDDDGDLDVLIMNMNEPPSLLRNEYAGGHHWLKVKLIGVRSNRAGLGARVTLSVGGRRQAAAALSQTGYYSHDDLRLHFGLGRERRAEQVEVRWPSGAIDRLEDVAGDRLITIKEGAGLIESKRR